MAIDKYQKIDKINPNKIIFSGNLNYMPNIDALNWLLNNCWEKFCKKNKIQNYILLEEEQMV